MKAPTIDSRVLKLEDYVFGEPDKDVPTGLLPRTARIEWKIDDLTLQVKDQRRILNQHTARLEDHTDQLKTLQGDVDVMRTDMGSMRTDMGSMRVDLDSMRIDMDSMNARLTNVESGVTEILRRLPEPTA